MSQLPCWGLKMTARRPCPPAHAAVAAAVEHFGGVDVLVNNAGRGLLGAVEEGTDSEVRSL
ncbi:MULTISPECIES: hypothetical protein [unclassified Streptomyces]|uniref:hypothetical protein n=1 Tax=unclassified Streptomyces TaxID=2593676 RepID=UPI003D8DACF7